MKIKSKLYKLSPGTYLMEFENYFDMGMSFLKMQEYYESSNKRFLKKHFDIFEFMKYYSDKEKQNYFSYTDDFVGYNVPSWVVNQFRGRKDYNIFEKELFKNINKIKEKNFYLIAAKKGKNGVVKHEIAHALFYNNPSYKKEMLNLVEDIDIEKRKKIHTVLKKMGYGKSVYDDEIQAYFSTGLTEELEKIKGINSHMKIFKKTFNNFHKEHKKHKKEKL